jgi:hypothetical protein
MPWRSSKAVCVGVCVFTGDEDEGRERGTRARRASDKGGGTLTFTVRVPPRSAAVHHAGRVHGGGPHAARTPAGRTGLASGELGRVCVFGS